MIRFPTPCGSPLSRSVGRAGGAALLAILSIESLPVVAGTGSELPEPVQILDFQSGFAGET
jgi:hypothetical protein